MLWRGKNVVRHEEIFLNGNFLRDKKQGKKMEKNYKKKNSLVCFDIF